MTLPEDEEMQVTEVGPALVDELTDENDYWLTITDAARVTRRQEVTIRRWIAAGQLPVRRQRMGLNKRTRHVRASDVSTLTPIIDPAAAISGPAAHMDLLSIPVQQAQIQATYQEVMQHITQFAQNLSELEQTQNARHQQNQEALAALHHELMASVQHLHRILEHENATLTDALQQERERAESQLHQLAAHVDHELAQRQAAERELTESLHAVEAGVSQLQAAIHLLEERQQTHQAQAIHQQQLMEQTIRQQQHDAEQMQRRMQQLEDELRRQQHHQQETDLLAQESLRQQRWWQWQQRHHSIVQRNQRRRQR